MKERDSAFGDLGSFTALIEMNSHQDRHKQLAKLQGSGGICLVSQAITPK